MVPVASPHADTSSTSVVVTGTVLGVVELLPPPAGEASKLLYPSFTKMTVRWLPLFTTSGGGPL